LANCAALSQPTAIASVVAIARVVAISSVVVRECIAIAPSEGKGILPMGVGSLYVVGDAEPTVRPRARKIA
jgi:hypothetical protein